MYPGTTGKKRLQMKSVEVISRKRVGEEGD
jgi:hypothetical protein